MAVATPRLISCAPKPPIWKHNLSPKIQNNRIEISRRDAAVLLTFLTHVPWLTHTAPANAFSIGISGPKDWLKEQKRKSSNFLLAPVDASRRILNTANLLLKAKESDYMEKDLEEVQNMFRSAARDCVPQERSSIVAFQANTGVEVCTFRLIVNKDPAKLQAEAILDDLIRQKLADALMDTISSLNKFEQGIKDCLKV